MTTTKAESGHTVPQYFLSSMPAEQVDKIVDAVTAHRGIAPQVHWSCAIPVGEAHSTVGQDVLDRVKRVALNLVKNEKTG